MGNTAIVKRLGFLVESLSIDADPHALSGMREMISTGISALDPARPRKGVYNTRWNLLLNVSKESFADLRRSV
jgi:predicted transcriptional regulator of viral defense system